LTARITENPQVKFFLLSGISVGADNHCSFDNCLSERLSRLSAVKMSTVLGNKLVLLFTRAERKPATKRKAASKAAFLFGH
jgi:hypothetical protein